MATIVDARGKACPQPVIDTKNAIKEQGTPVITMVDNDIARQKVSRKWHVRWGLNAESSEIDGGWRILIQPVSTDVLSAVMNDAGDALAGMLPDLDPVPCCTPAPAGPTVVVLSSSCMGTGDDTLGGYFMKGLAELRDPVGRGARNRPALQRRGETVV